MVWNDRAFRTIVDSHKNPSNLVVVCCPNTTTHSPHEWTHYDIDNNIDEQVWCAGDFLTTT